MSHGGGGVPRWRGWGRVNMPLHASLDADFHQLMAMCLVLIIEVYGSHPVKARSHRAYYAA